MVFVTILLNLLNRKHLLKIEQIILPEHICTSQLQLRTKRNPIQKKKKKTRHESGCNAEIAAGRQLSKSHKEYLMKKAKSAANFVGKEKDPKLSGFDLFTSTAGNLELRSFSRFIELMLVISPSTAKLERSFSLMNRIS